MCENSKNAALFTTTESKGRNDVVSLSASLRMAPNSDRGSKVKELSLRLNAHWSHKSLANRLFFRYGGWSSALMGVEFSRLPFYFGPN